ncbi:MAG: AIR carboxylase family protein [Polyangiaceae bacterium]
MALKVLIVMGSDSDLDQLTPAWTTLQSLGVQVEVHVASAHRSPDRVLELARGARGGGFGVILAAAGGAAHLAGVFAAHTTLPVLAVPIVVGTLGGVDALLSAVQMPGGVPIASVGIGGARNAGFSRRPSCPPPTPSSPRAWRSSGRSRRPRCSRPTRACRPSSPSSLDPTRPRQEPGLLAEPGASPPRSSPRSIPCVFSSPTASASIGS